MIVNVILAESFRDRSLKDFFEANILVYTKWQRKTKPATDCDGEWFLKSKQYR